MENEVKPLVLSDLFKTNFEMFSGLEDTVRKSQINKLNYIDTIARQLEKDVSKANLLEFISHENGIITASNVEINKALVGYDTKDREKGAFVISPEIVEKLASINNKSSRDRIAHMKREVHSKTEDMVASQERYKETMLFRAKLMRDIESITLCDNEPFSDMLKKIQEENKFIILSIEDTKFTFTNTENIVCTYKNDAAGIDLRVDLGKFLFSIKADTFSLSIDEYKDNTTVHGRVHPHISSSDLCLGNMSEIFTEASDKRDLLGILNTTYAILTTYNNDDPYDPLYKYAIKSGQVQPNGEIMGEDSGDGSVCVETHSIYCDECDTHFDDEVEGDYFSGYCPECDNFIETEL